MNKNRDIIGYYQEESKNENTKFWIGKLWPFLSQIKKLEGAKVGLDRIWIFKDWRASTNKEKIKNRFFIQI